MTTATDQLSSIPHPSGAVEVDEWADIEFGPDHAHRYFRGSSWFVVRDDDDEDGDITVEVDGIQRSDGAVDRKLRVCHLHHAEPITPEQARQLARALIAAADEYEQMNGYDQL